jgi:predicted membrane protein
MIPEVLGYAFPNDIHILWSLMIVTYPYVTGLVAGAFIVSSLYHVFGRKELWPIGRFSLVASFAFMAVATLPLINHLGHPERAFNIMVTPSSSSAMAGFGLAYNWYLMILILEIWFVFRKDIVMTARQSRGFKRWVFSLLALRTYDISEEALKTDHKIVTVLTAIGILGLLPARLRRLPLRRDQGQPLVVDAADAGHLPLLVSSPASRR